MGVVGDAVCKLSSVNSAMVALSIAGEGRSSDFESFKLLSV